MVEPGRAQRRRGAAPRRLVLTRRSLQDPIHGQCGGCFETRRLQQLVLLGTDELATLQGIPGPCELMKPDA
jgi:hypothetical protein